jgi:3'(2'), 5'-bisphosphate nucleotidase
MNSKEYSEHPEQLLQPVTAIALRACEAVLEIYNSDFAIEHKDDDTPLTAADLASHHSICKDLEGLTPGIPILSEESDSLPYTARQSWDTYWLVDPLDGTREFVKRNGEFTVNIALIHKHRPVLGAVYVPVSKSGFFASIGKGAYRVDNGETPVRIHTRPASPNHLTVAGSRTHGNDLQQRFIDSLGPGTKTVTIGSSIKFCLVAEGKIDIYPRFGPTSEWDTAAAQCIVEEAGGMVTDTRFRPLQYNTKESLLNPHFLVIGDKQFDWKRYLINVRSEE